MKAVLFCLFIFLICVAADDANAAKQNVCVKSDGSTVVKRRCRSKRGETKFNALEFAESLVGPQGPKGDTGPQGVTGPPGFADYEELYLSNSIVIGSIGEINSDDCPLGKEAIGASCIVNSTNAALIYSARIAGNEDGTWKWRCQWRNLTGSTINTTANITVFCADVE